MGIVQQAIGKMIAPALAPLVERVVALESRQGLSEADQIALAKTAQFVAELEAIAGEVAPSVTITDVL